VQKTNIEWTDFSSNPLRYRRTSDGKIVGACVKVSLGCAHCYSEKITLRYARGKLYNAANMEELEPFLDGGELSAIANRRTCQGVALAGRRVFVGDMTDVFGEWVPDAMLDQLFGAFALRQDVTFQVLTKRALRMRLYFASYRPVLPGRIGARDMPDGGTLIAPLPNVWLGVSVENQAAADERILRLLQTPAAVRFVSYEPALGPVDFSAFMRNSRRFEQLAAAGWANDLPALDWIICGGESGPGKRPFDPDWARAVRDQCRDAGVPFFMKQIDKVREIPSDLLIREFPCTRS
jgi:protein gp37